MIVHRNFTLQQPIPRSVVTMGSFDGVHLGHRKILERVVEYAHHEQAESVLITFDQHPRKVLATSKNGSNVKLLTTPEERRDIFTQIGIDHLVCLSFNQELAAMEPEEFIREMFVNHLNAVHVITGYGHRFGKGGRGDHALLEQESLKYHFTTEMIPMQDVEQNMISSTLIRTFLADGAVDQAAKYLGYTYPLTGHVVHGEKKGHQLGFPTANIEPSHPEKLIPADGVYAVKVSVKGIWYQGMLNIGLRPTLNGSHKTIEVHLFDFDSTVYGDQITITFEHRIRAEQRFASVELLRQQLFHDKEAALSLLNT